MIMPDGLYLFDPAFVRFEMDRQFYAPPIPVYEFPLLHHQITSPDIT